MLKDNLYSVNHLEIGEAYLNAILKLDSQHPIFKGHFPEQPILPGVCMVQMIKELLEFALEKKFLLIKAGDIKFLKMINPTEIKTIQLAIGFSYDVDNKIKVAAKFIHEESVCCKLNGLYKELVGF